MRWMSSILTRLRFLRADQVAHLAFGHFKRDRLAGELAVSKQPIERAFKIAAVVRHGFGDEHEHGRGNIEAGMMLLGRGGARLENFKPQLLAKRAHLDHQPAGEARANPLFQAFKIGRRSVGSDDHLPAGVDERIERVTELGLGRFSLQELQIVDHQHINGAQRLFESDAQSAPAAPTQTHT